ncbi:MAG: MFS transporter [Alphaproteobacteria bacterium]
MPNPPRRLSPAFNWPVVVACFFTALFGWGFGFYGQAVYLAELHKLHGWSTALISSATTLYYLFGAALLTLAPAAIERLGPRAVHLGGAAILAAAAVGLALASAPWQLYAANLVMAFGWASTSTTAIATTISLWFHRRRGLALSLALNGASAAGFTVAPALVQLSASYGLLTAVLAVAAALFALLVPAALLGMRAGRREEEPEGGDATPPARSAEKAPARPADPLPVLLGRAEALASFRFWSVTAPFALALAAQVGFIVHQVAFLLPTLGNEGTSTAVAATAIAAAVGRVGLGLVIDRLDQRIVSAAACASQVAALLAMVLFHESALALTLSCVVFGLSVGNLITLPALIIQHEFAARSFGLVMGLSTAICQFTYAFGPALLGAVHDASGGYRPALGLCMALEIAAACIILVGRRAKAGRTP